MQEFRFIFRGYLALCSKLRLSFDSVPFVKPIGIWDSQSLAKTAIIGCSIHVSIDHQSICILCLLKSSGILFCPWHPGSSHHSFVYFPLLFCFIIISCEKYVGEHHRYADEPDRCSAPFPPLFRVADRASLRANRISSTRTLYRYISKFTEHPISLARKRIYMYVVASSITKQMYFGGFIAE